MVFKGLVAAATAVALSASPAVAAANGAAASPIAASQIAPADESVEGSELRGLRGGFIIPLLAIAAIVLGILAATGNLENDRDTPRSPG